MSAPTTAVRNALAAYLQAGLVGTYPTVKVWPTWPQPGIPLPEFAVSVLTVAPITVEEHEPRFWSVDITNSTSGNALYSYGTATIGMQLDCWARYQESRDELADSVRSLLNRSPVETLGVTALPGAVNHPGLVLALPDFFGVTADYRFGQIATPIENSLAAQSGEWRSTWNGHAFMYLVTKDVVSLMKDINLHINGDIYTVGA